MSSSIRSIGAGLSLGLFCIMTPTSALADEPKQTGQLAWDPAWPQFHVSEYVVTGVAGIASLGAYFYLSPPTKPRWTGGILLDNTLRDELRLRSPALRDAARAASNVTAVTTVVVTVGIDSLVVPLLRHQPDVALQLTLMDTEAFAISTLITTTMFKTIGRGRPSYADCQRDPSFDPLCNSGDTSSFPSGHTNAAFTAAGLSCAHHLHLALYGNTWADTLACAGEIALAGATGGLRVLGDRHYATDVWAGAIIGFAVGYGMPTLLHYSAAGRGSEASVTVQPLGTGLAGPVISGTF
jgi:membrane-associated phospholipid phosphatase